VSDQSHGYAAAADLFVRARSRIGEAQVHQWALTLGPAARVLDAGCGHGVPITEALMAAGCDVYAIDASPSLVEAFRSRFPGVPIACEPVQTSTMFERSYDGIVAWGLLFLLDPEEQPLVLARLASALAPEGQLLFTAPWQVGEWRDALTGHVSRSLGADVYRRTIATSGLTLKDEFDDEGDNHYYLAARVKQA
jgi:2-polyprenyl-3-methyl-5-hydroxy-6-metoxy-1,4-benzoquinol methylase